MKRKYTALRIISAFYKFIAILALILTIAGAVLSILTGDSLILNPGAGAGVPVLTVGPLLSAAAILIPGLISAITLFAFANIIDVFLATEENTRAAAEYTRATAVLMQRFIRSQRSTTRAVERPESPPAPH